MTEYQNPLEPKQEPAEQTEQESNLKKSTLYQPISFFSDFINFIKKYGILGLALGVVVGNSVNTFVKSFVDNIMNPLLAKLVDAKTLSSWIVWDIKIGQFASDVLSFLILMLVVYLSIRFFIYRFLSEDELEKLKFEKKS